MSNQEIANNLSKLLSTFNDRRVITELQIKEVLTAITAILAENKKSVESLVTEIKQTVGSILERNVTILDSKTQENIKSVLKSLETEYKGYLTSLKQNSTITRGDIEKAMKAQNDRAFKRLQDLINNVELPKDGSSGQDGLPGRDGKDGSPDTPVEVRDKLEILKDDERLDWSAIKGLPDYFKIAKKAGRQMLVGGIRFFENLADVSIPITDKRKDLIAQYSTTNNRWESGVALTVSATAPTNPKTLDLWVDIS